MPEKRRKYDPEFKDGAVRLVLDTGRPIAVELPADLGGIIFEEM
jgi:transposase